ncbi:Uncharacterised protein [Serratia fonticola]|nr:Uncharacterised protein [Serratia fonticola]
MRMSKLYYLLRHLPGSRMFYLGRSDYIFDNVTNNKNCNIF